MADETATPDSTDRSESKTLELRDKAPVEREHEFTSEGRTWRYRSTTGMLPLTSATGELLAQIFFIAYTVERADGEPARPLSFAFNGGPGSASIWLHMGALGPRRVQLNDDGTMPAPPFQVVDNAESWLPFTDLVFIDPVGTGYSRAKDEETAKRYWSYSGDIESLGEFIRLYLTRYGRWASPLFLAGESYGTLRAAGLARHLIDRGIAFSGILLISATLSYMTLDSSDGRGNDLPAMLFLPSFAATAHYHGKLDDDLQAKPLSEIVGEVERWSLSEYLLALAHGDELPDERRKAVAAQLARYAGLDARWVDDSELRVNIHHFCKELLRDRRLTVGRLDARFTGHDALGVGSEPEFDPSLASPTAPFTAAFNDHVRRTLGYETDAVYETLSMAVNQAWTFDASRNGYAETSEALRATFARNPHLRVLIASGYYDLATPYFAVRYNVSHMALDRALRERITWTYYEAGHMMYIDGTQREQFARDVRAFISEGERDGRS